MSWSDYAPLMHDAVLTALGDTISASTASGFEFTFQASWEMDDYLEDDGRFVRLFTREALVLQKFSNGGRVVIEGVEYSFMAGSEVRRDGGVEFKAERRSNA